MHLCTYTPVMNKVLTILCLIFSLHAASQSAYPKDYFQSPLGIPLQLSGSFGELRSNHFHTGIDFRTQQKEGLPIYACAEGYVSRIKVSTTGNGKTIYIDHPNGYTTVYAHLQKFDAAIASYVKQAQYQAQLFEVELFPKPNELPVSQGQQIAFSGNSGSSSGPHLHFEIRETISELSVNPLFFGFDKFIADTKRPVISSILVHPLNEMACVNGTREALNVNLTLQENGNYIADPIKAKGKIGFSISVTDAFDFAYGKNGPYSIESCLNGTRNFIFTADKFSFDEVRYINAYIDYYRFKKTGVRYQKLFMNPTFPLRNLQTDMQAGVIDVQTNLAANYRIEVSDYAGNKTTIDIPIIFDPKEPVAEIKPKNEFPILKYDIENLYEEGRFAVAVKPLTFYANFPLKFKVKDNELEFAADEIPAHQNVTITYEADDLPPEIFEKSFIGSVDGNRLRFIPTKKQNNKLIAYTRNLGAFRIGVDTIPPNIKPYNIKEGKWISKQQTILFVVSDNGSGISKYEGFINGKWVLFEYEPKDKSLTYIIDDSQLVDGKNDLRVIVTDELGNSAIFETSFYRKLN